MERLRYLFEKRSSSTYIMEKIHRLYCKLGKKEHEIVYVEIIFLFLQIEYYPTYSNLIYCMRLNNILYIFHTIISVI